ncbi:hypothetical protein CEQ90_20290 [Lewinellaceae bacterium SD302]|nr:hypothetical protein CEQ90_20290 [Lewinellaceae bacterium SD302]
MRHRQLPADTSAASVTYRRHQFRIFDPSRLKIGSCVGAPVLYNTPGKNGQLPISEIAIMIL